MCYNGWEMRPYGKGGEAKKLRRKMSAKKSKARKVVRDGKKVNGH